MTGEYLKHTSNEAREELDKYLRELPSMPDGRLNVKWANHRRGYIERYGEYSVAVLIPEEITVASAPITSLINHLLKHNIRTIYDLDQVDLNEYRQNRGFGQVFYEFSQLLKAAAKEKIRNLRSGYLPE